MNAALSAIFFLSGAAALLFESLWFRQTGIAFGNSVWASALVLSSFMAGIALGNGLAARFGALTTRPVRLYAGLELAVAITGVGLVALLPLLAGLLAPVFRPFLEYGAALQLLRFFVAFCLLLIPATAMGATLPLLVKALTREPGDFGRVLGMLYGWNTLGGMAGAVMGELCLIEAFGVMGTGVVAASLNLLAAGGAIAVIRRHFTTGPAAPKDSAPLSGSAWRLMGAACFAGGILLALEVVWVRFLSLFISGTSLAFAAMLSVVLAGIGAGSLAGGWWLRKPRDAARGAFATALVAGALAGLSYAVFALPLQRLGLSHSPALANLLMVAVPLMLPTAFASGVLFTLLGTALHDAIGVSVRAAGLVTLANTVGAMVGPILAGFVMLSNLGVELSILVLSAAYALVAALTLKPGALGVAGWASGVLFLVGMLTFPVGRMQETYLEPVRQRAALYGEEVVAEREGPSETIHYARAEFMGERTHTRLMTNGFFMSANLPRAERYMRAYAHLPAVLHPGIKKALLISYGLGNTAQALTRNPALETLDVVDISRDVLEMSDLIFPDPKEHPLRDPRVRVHIEDGRYFLQTTPERFDLITAEPPPLRASRTVYLYTEEYFRLVRDRLRDGGMVSYWLPVQGLGKEETAAITSAFCAVFDDCSLWDGSMLNWMLIGSRGPLQPIREERLAELWADEGFVRDLRRIAMERPAHLAATFLGDTAFLSKLTGSVAPLHDDRPLGIHSRPPEIPRSFYLEIKRPRAAQSRFEKSALIARIWPESLRAAALEAFEVQGVIEAGLRVKVSTEPTNPVDLLRRVHRLLEDGNETAVVWALGIDPREVRIAEAKAREGAKGPAIALRLGAAALGRSEWLVAAEHFRRAGLQDPRFGAFDVMEAYALGRAGEREKARATLGKRPELQRELTRALASPTE